MEQRPGQGKHSITPARGVIEEKKAGLGRLVAPSERGQSLVETVLFLPILFLIMVGLIETSNAILSYMKLSTALQEGAKFGATGGTNQGIAQVIFDNPSLPAGVTPDNTDGYVIRGKVKSDNSVQEWHESHIYGNGPAESGLTPEQMGEWFAEARPEGGESQRVLLVLVRHRPGSLLGVPGVSAISQRVTLQVHSIMPVGGSDAVAKSGSLPTKGCSAFPLALHASLVKNVGKYQVLDDIPNGTEEGDFGWLRWQATWPATTETLARAVRYPGTSQTYEGLHGGDGVYVDDWVPAANDPSGDKSLVTAELAKYRQDKRYVRVILWDQYKNGHYNVTGFAVVQPMTYTRDLKTLAVRFSHVDKGCPSLAQRSPGVAAEPVTSRPEQDVPATAAQARRINRFAAWAAIFGVLVMVGTLIWVWPRTGGKR